MRRRRAFSQLAGPGGLALALIGYWAPWLAGPAAALQLNAYELSEWLTFLPAAQSGALPIDRLAFLLPGACLAGLLGLAAGEFDGRPAGRGRLAAWLPGNWVGWGLLALAGLCALAVFPYYPYFLSAYADPEFSFQFWAACVTAAGIPLAFWLRDDAGALAQMALALAGLFLTGRALWGLWPAAAELGLTWQLGWGWPATLLGFALALLAGWSRLFRPRQ